MSTPHTKINVIVTGATGMVGEGVLQECLQREEVGQVLSLSRRPYGISHPKLTEVLHTNFLDLSAVEDRLSGYDACFFCLGVSSAGMEEAEYRRLTYGLTLHVARTLARQNPTMTFCYISGAGTDSSEQGRLMWARVKGKTENDLLKLPFKAVYNFRPAVIEPGKGLKNTLSYYKYLGWLLPLIRRLAPNYICTLKELATAMIEVALHGDARQVLEVPDIRALAARSRPV